MANPRVFISHSSKDAELAGPAPVDPAQIERHERLRFAQKVRQGIVERLKAAGFEILLDVDRLEPSDPWRAKLHLWLQTCHAAVILLNKEAVESRWVLKETNILLHRRALQEKLQQKLRVIPVFLGDFSSSQLKAADFDDVEVLEPQAARLLDTKLTDANAGLLADKVVDSLRGLAPVTQEGALELWVKNVAALLRKAEDIHLEEARKAANVGDEDWAGTEQGLQAFAYHLLRSPIDTVVKALYQLWRSYTADEYRRLAELLLPVWVDEAAARRLLDEPTETVPARRIRVLAIDAEEYETAADYVKRAWCCPNWSSSRIMNFNRPVGEGQIAELLDGLKSDLLKQLTLPSKESLLIPALKRNPFYVVLGNNVPVQSALLEQMANAYPPVKFIVLGGEQFARVADGSLPLTRLQPVLGPEAEGNAVISKADIGQLLSAARQQQPGSP